MAETQPSSRSYSAAARGPPPSSGSMFTTTSLCDILDRAQKALQAVLDAHSRATSDSSTSSPAVIAELAALARPSVRDLQAAHAGLAAATVLHSPQRSPSATLSSNSPIYTAPHKPSSTAQAWIPDRCIVLDPPEDRLRRLPSDFSRMGKTIETALQTTFSLNSSSLVQMLRRTIKGGYCAQLHPSCSPQARSLHSLTFSDGTVWQCTPLSQTPRISTSGTTNIHPTSIRRDSFVVSRVPTSIPDSGLLRAFADANAARLGLSSEALLARLKSADRLQRRLSHGSNAGQWVPSHSVRFCGEPALVTSILATGHVVMDFQALQVRPFSFPARHCFHCGQFGHVAKHCRGRCHRCASRHPTQGCPLNKQPRRPAVRSSRPLSSAPGSYRTSTQVDEMDVTGSRPAGSLH